MQSEMWVVFEDADGNELCSHTVRGTFPGETQATIEFIASEYNVSPSEITVKIVER